VRAVRIHRHGGVDVLSHETAPDPRPGPLDVLVRVHACALNHLDVWVRQGIPGIAIPLPHTLGSDIAGTIAAVGKGVRGLATGQPVMVSPGLSCGICQACVAGLDNLCLSYSILGYQVPGGYAELVRVPAVNVIPKPERLSFEEAASIPLVFLTAWHMLVARAQLRPGEDVLVQAAGSGVGIAAVQIAKLLGARVIATASTEAKLKKARQLGADETINYTKKDFYAEVKRITGKKGVEVVFEHIGGRTFEESLLCLARNGRLVTCGATAGGAVTVDLRYLLTRQLSITGSNMGSKGELLSLLPHLASGRLRPVVDRVLPLSQAAQAHRLMMDRAGFGKLVLKVAE
jgi:NADPH:quinone reductase-like Zn-dependent oxidoreductase